MSSRVPPGKLPPRVRIAPSPTGDPHVGTAYIALFNFVFAHKYQGRFILRIEDTDRERSTPGSEAAIFEALRWLGLEWDEGPDKGGPFGPYRQSERLLLYHEQVTALLERGHAYRCFCTRERLDELRKIRVAERQAPGYDGHCRDLDAQHASSRAAAGEQHVVRMKVPHSGETIVRDELRGSVHFENKLIDDQVILKSDGFPTYHLANVVDDHFMEITHVIRGDEWITSTPKHILLYEAFGWDAPRFYHLGLLRNADRSKLSKRKNPVSVFHYRDLGYLPETFRNFLGTLGFSMPDERERFGIEEMIAEFDWARVSAGGPVFDAKKLEAFNAADIRAMPLDSLYQRIMSETLAPLRVRKLLAHAQERITRLDDFVPYVSLFFGGSIDYEPVAQHLCVQARSREDCIGVLDDFIQELEIDVEARSFTAPALDRFARAFCQRKAWKTKELFTLLRVASTGRTASPPLFDSLETLGKDRVRLRLRDAIAFLRARA